MIDYRGILSKENCLALWWKNIFTLECIGNFHILCKVTFIASISCLGNKPIVSATLYCLSYRKAFYCFIQTSVASCAIQASAIDFSGIADR